MDEALVAALDVGLVLAFEASGIGGQRVWPADFVEQTDHLRQVVPQLSLAVSESRCLATAFAY